MGWAVGSLLGGALPVRAGVNLAPLTTLRAGGPAEWFAKARSVDELAVYAEAAQARSVPTLVLGSGSNLLPSDQGVRGLVLLNVARRIDIDSGREVVADTGCALQDLFLKCAQVGLAGFSFAVGIPGTLGGALVSNAGAYRSCVSERLEALEIVFEGKRQWVGPDWMRFGYRDSVLRRPDPPPCTMLRARFRLERGDPHAIFEAAREFQRQRISKQPPPASAGSFFKNVNDAALAASLEGLPESLRAAGVVPAGYLIEAAGMKGYQFEGACSHPRHANFLVNDRGASARALRTLAEHIQAVVRDRFGVQLEEEVLYVGEW